MFLKYPMLLLSIDLPVAHFSLISQLTPKVPDLLSNLRICLDCFQQLKYLLD